MPTASADARLWRRRSLIASTCVQNEALGTTDFVDSKGSVRARRRAAERLRGVTRRAQLVFRTTPLERHRVVAQIGTACPGASAVLTAPVPDDADAGVACS